jgi:hypothetical protein
MFGCSSAPRVIIYSNRGWSNVSAPRCPEKAVSTVTGFFVSSRKATRQSEADDVARTAGQCVVKIVSTSRLCRGYCVSLDQVQLTLFKISSLLVVHPKILIQSWLWGKSYRLRRPIVI